MDTRKILVVKLGNDYRPASEADIKDMARILDGINDEDKMKLVTLVTHHAIKFEVLEIPADTEIKSISAV